MKAMAKDSVRQSRDRTLSSVTWGVISMSFFLLGLITAIIKTSMTGMTSENIVFVISSAISLLAAAFSNILGLIAVKSNMKFGREMAEIEADSLT